jgi:DNA-binding NarL/FixJ family response regulator
VIRVVLVDDQELVRTGLLALAERDGDITVVGEAGTGRAGLSRVRELHPEVVLMDIRMPEVDGLQATVDDTPLQVLTERARGVLALVGRGLSNEEIAQELFLSPATARTYVSRLLTKLGARDRARLVVLAYETGLVVPGR